MSAGLFLSHGTFDQIDWSDSWLMGLAFPETGSILLTLDLRLTPDHPLIVRSNLIELQCSEPYRTASLHLVGATIERPSALRFTISTGAGNDFDLGDIHHAQCTESVFHLEGDFGVAQIGFSSASLTFHL